MRITNAQVTRDTIARLTVNSSRLAEAQDRVSTGLKVQKMSDDPTAASAIMQASSGMRAIEQFRTNVAGVGSALDAEDNALDQVGSLITRAKELAVSQSGANASAQTRQAAAQEVKALLAQAVQIGNTRIGDAYLFGGANSPSTAPFDVNQSNVVPRYVSIVAPAVTPQLPQGMRSVEIAAGQTMQGAHDGDAVFVQTGVLQSLHDLYTALNTNDMPGITTAMPELDTAFDTVQSLVGDVGARRNQVDTVDASLDAFESNLKTLKSGLAEVDMEEAITEMVAKQTAYQAAMLASSKVMGLSLTEYLR
ncbi:MAG: flagellar hook-associated protein FlgL [Gemmatirosa sp.]|nr:flagellar hook-associated protein FlgL [Gemmatirosa sp.]